MPRRTDNPNLAITPNFQSPEYAEARAQLTYEAVDDQQAATILANLWRIQNEVDKCHWAVRLENEAQEAEAERREAAEEEAQRLLTQKAEQEAAIQEERKKNKAKYAPIKDSGEYCELFYFTNNGLEEASRSTFTADEDALVMMPTSDGLHKWIPASAARDPKVQVIKDENLTWEQFNKSAPRMITLMKENDWPDDQINMHISFWSALQNHRWRHDFDTHKQRALLLYQAQQRRRWHLAAGSSNSWSLAKINQDLLLEA
ncbi:hypothetical protein DEU56DRAFT_736994 [Suillus clintonianus]|uniref:uncharacterized protein n=1 Tax=Suillus clintonianus TaxID=1904413 RepID=UPI001B87062D|nr:uncharacterized protein DEU56DRAFT_736994 [Suillus clintonianus]KAG2137013.1 hypothetical protein DEU56DRAFT_736994 [Suillus clintonianus]